MPLLETLQESGILMRPPCSKPPAAGLQDEGEAGLQGEGEEDGRGGGQERGTEGQGRGHERGIKGQKRDQETEEEGAEKKTPLRLTEGNECEKGNPEEKLRSIVKGGRTGNRKAYKWHGS
mmetsp:Transcript_18548/g.25792  ORF Transcript_18548/g.25792 Transcript_18548/m.25792 type:complete len:120 (-) Transcript_18548:58-417(-)